MKKNHIIFSIILLILFFILFSQGRGSQTAGKERRIALIIGNAHYKSSPLRNPVNDAADMARVLRELGFDVMLRTDAGQKEMENAIREFGNKLRRGGVGLFYFSGHGMQVNGVNYLIPVNEDIQAEDEVRYNAVDANLVLSKMESAGNAMNIMMLDACRDNPFARSFRSSTRGLVQIDAPQGSLIVYATSPGKTAADGEGRNGIFTKHLLKMISVMNLEIRQLIQEVRKAVVDETNGNQTPWESSSLMDNFYFTILPPKPPDISIVDITSIKKAKEKRESIKSGWESWQARMKSDFMEIEKVDKSPAYTREEKESAWRKFLESYKADNPFSTADEQLRQRVTQRIKGLLKRIHDKVESQKLEVGKIVPLSEVDNPPILIKKVAPKYHRSSIISFDYKIKVRILITEDGEVENAVIIRHAIPHNIRSAVIKAIKEWKYTPALKNGVKVKVWKVVNIRLERK